MATRRWLLSTALAVSAISGVATAQAQEDNERPVSIDDVPGPARDSILSEVAGGMLMSVDEETLPSGEHVYEAHIHKGARHILFWVDAAGNILLRH